MERAKGYYCLVQYTPDRARGEAANVGVLVFSPAHHFIDVELSPTDDRVERFFGGEWELDLERLRAMKASLKKRVRVEHERFQDLEDLEHFVATRANEIILTPPRPLAVSNPRADLASLFRELVHPPGGGVNGGRHERPVALRSYERPRPEQHLAPRHTELARRLDAALSDPQLEGRVERNVAVTIPVIGRHLEVPYAYRGRKWNLLYPKEFSRSRGTATRQACELATKGALIARHPDPDRGPMQLVVIPEFAGEVNGLPAMIEQVFRENQVAVVPPDRLDRLPEELDGAAADSR